jgi:hypothetical protein
MARLRKPSSLNDLTDLLFPHSPIVVEYDFTIINGEKTYEWHIYVEGEWYDKEQTLEKLQLRLMEIITSQGHDWPYKSTRVNPNWGGWSQITEFDLAFFKEFSERRRAYRNRKLDNEL